MPLEAANRSRAPPAAARWKRELVLSLDHGTIIEPGQSGANRILCGAPGGRRAGGPAPPRRTQTA